MLVVDKFTKMAHFGACHKTDDASHAVDLYFEVNIRLHGVLKIIMSDRDQVSISFLEKSLASIGNWAPIQHHLPSTD